jgi:biopolymer transport protein ExbB/TolQ
VIVIALAGIFCWLLMLTVALRLGAAAKRGDELNGKARRFVAEVQTRAEIIPFKRVLSQRQPCRAPIQCSRSCTISSSSR